MVQVKGQETWPPSPEAQRTEGGFSSNENCQVEGAIWKSISDNSCVFDTDFQHCALSRNR